MPDESQPAVTPETDAAPDDPTPADTLEEEELVAFIYDGPPIHLIGHGPITAGTVTVTPAVARGLANRPDFKRARKPRK